MPARDVVAEHAALSSERAGLRNLLERDAASSPAQVVRFRSERIQAIDRRLQAIERTKTWKRAHPPLPPGHQQLQLGGTEDA